MTALRRITILGLGLIGGSLGLAWKQRRDDVHVAGYDPDAEACRIALERGAVDETADAWEDVVPEADLVVIAAPILASMRLLEAVGPTLRRGAFVTDVCSVKQVIVRQAREHLPAHTTFVGGHPMAGAEHSGVAHADPYLFENATYVVCPPEEEGSQARYGALLDLLGATGAQVLPMDAARHDRIAAAVSHLPQLLAVALAELAGDLHEEEEVLLNLAAGGFRDMTRIAASPFPMWRQILVANHGAVLDALGAFAQRLQRIRGRLAAEEMEALEASFRKGGAVRERIPRSTKGFLAPLADLYVYARDRPGELAAMTAAVAEAGVNVKDLELLRVRENAGGAFRMGFSTLEDARAAQEALHGAGFTTRALEAEA